MRKAKVLKCSKDGCENIRKPGKKGLCDYHYAKAASARRKKARADKLANGEPLPTKRAIESVRKRLSKKLDIVFSKLTKRIYPFICHGKCDGRPLKLEEAQCCHFVSRRKVLLRWFIGNALPGCATCNLSEQDHVYFLGKYLNKYYGDGFAEDVSNAGKRNAVKLDIENLQNMLDLYDESLKYTEKIKILPEQEQKKLLIELRETIIKQTKFF